MDDDDRIKGSEIECRSCRFSTANVGDFCAGRTALLPGSRDAALCSQVRPRDNEFREAVLRSRGVVIEGTTYSLAEPFAHFGTQHTAAANCRSLRELGNLRVWLKDNDSLFEEISEEYHSMVQNNLCEAEFATYGKEKLFKNEPRRFEIPEDRKWRTERMIELVAKPSPRERWEAPPVLDSSGSHRDNKFDIRPDCSYWLSLQAFNKDFVMCDRVTCPYFTVEFKRYVIG